MTYLIIGVGTIRQYLEKNSRRIKDCYEMIGNHFLIKGGNSLVVQWLSLCSFTAEGRSSIPVWGTKIL